MRLWNVWGDLQHGGGHTTIAAIAAITTTTITDHCHNYKYDNFPRKSLTPLLLLCQATTLVLGEVRPAASMSPMLGAGVELCLHFVLGLLWWSTRFGDRLPPKRVQVNFIFVESCPLNFIFVESMHVPNVIYFTCTSFFRWPLSLKVSDGSRGWPNLDTQLSLMLFPSKTDLTSYTTRLDVSIIWSPACSSKHIPLIWWRTFQLFMFCICST